MHHPTDRITHTTAFVTPVVEHWLEREIAQWVHPMKDRSDDPSHHERTLALKQMWPDLVIVHGKPRHPQSHGSVERFNCDIRDMLTAWLYIYMYLYVF